MTNCNQSYFYDGSILLAEKVGSQIQKIYINDGQGIVGMVRPIYDGSNNLTHYQRLYYLYDSLGSVSGVTGEHGLPLQNYTYSPYGTCLNVVGDPINNLQFVGRYGGYLDNDTGLTYFWHRWYDSKDGRWISRDPIGVLGGINLYGYVKNQANNKTDGSGYCCIPPLGPSSADMASIDPISRTIINTFSVCSNPPPPSCEKQFLDRISHLGLDETALKGVSALITYACPECELTIVMAEFCLSGLTGTEINLAIADYENCMKNKK